LKTIAYLTIYANPEDCPCPISDYQLGFKVDTSLLEGYEKYFEHTLVAISKQNPFTLGQIHPISWTEVPFDEFPVDFISTALSYHIGESMTKFNPGQCYKSETDLHDLYVLPYINIERNVQQSLRLVAVDKIDFKVVYDNSFFSGKSASFTSLYSQWTGYLFENKPPVIFGFLSYSFGCSGIDYIDEEEKGIYINCDNRH